MSFWSSSLSTPVPFPCMILTLGTPSITASSTYLVTLSTASFSLSPLTSISVLKFSFLSLIDESYFTVDTGLAVSFTALLYSLEVILSTLSSGILLLMFPMLTTTAFEDTFVTSPTIPLSFTRTFSPAFSGADLNASSLSLSACCSISSLAALSSAFCAFLCF